MLERITHALLCAALLLALPRAAQAEGPEADQAARTALALASVRAEPRPPPCPYGCCANGCECVQKGRVECARSGCHCDLAGRAKAQDAAAVLTVYCDAGAVLLLDGVVVPGRGVVRVLVSDPFSATEEHSYTLSAGGRTRSVRVRGGDRQTVDLRPLHRDHAPTAHPVAFPAMPMMQGGPYSSHMTNGPPMMTGGGCGPRG